MAENLLKNQEDLATTMAKGCINFKKSPKDRITLSYIETRLENLEQQWNLFVNTHRKIVHEMKKEDYASTSYCKENIYDIAEEEYLGYKALLRESLLKFKAKVNDVHSESKRLVSVKLPEISLPKFNGSYSEWINFKDMFRSLVDRNDALDEVQKLHYLKSALSGEAEALVKTIPITKDNYKICWERLTSRYDNKRLMANSFIRRLMTQKGLAQESAVSIRQLLDTTRECIQSLRNLGINTTSWDLILIYIITQKLDPSSRDKWEAKMGETGDELPTFRDFERFLETRFRSLEYKVTEKDSSSTLKSAHATTTEPSPVCLCCGEKHKLNHCKQFLKEGVDARRHLVQSRHLCYNCLSPDHSVYGCSSSTTCRVCKRRHHTLLHPKSTQANKADGSLENDTERVVVSNPFLIGSEDDAVKPDAEVFTTCFSASQGTVLLATALVNVSSQVKNNSAVSMLRCLLDQGSQASFITESAAQLLGLKRNKEKIKVSGLGGSGSVISKSSVNLCITSCHDSSFALTIKAHVLEAITTLLPGNTIKDDQSLTKVLSTLKLADPSFNNPGGIDLLLGAEVYSRIMMDGLIRSANGTLIVQNTKLGWILSGVVQSSPVEDQPPGSLYCHKVTVTQVDDDELLRKFWEMESEPGTKNKNLSQEEEACEQLFAKTTARDEFGRYIVKLPFKDDNPLSQYGGSKEIALKRFHSLEKRFSKQPSLKTEYCKVLQEYVTMGHMEVCEDKSNQNAVYLPHHAVVREDKASSKVRIVFDASCEDQNGASLNNDLMVGPKLQPELRHLVMRWRCYPIAIVADIVKMYRQVKVTEDDSNFQRIVWRENPNDELQHFRLTRVTFGTSSAPYLAVRALQQLAYDEGASYPLAADRVLTEFYVDDLMTGCYSVSEGVEVFSQMTELLIHGGFPLQKWSSNSKELLKAIGHKGPHDQKNIDFKTDELTKILGLVWDRAADKFRFKVNVPPLSNSPKTIITKRSVISDIAKLFDPLGWLAPVIVTAKIFIQKLWLSGIGWDDKLPSDLLQEWLTFRRDLKELEAFHIPRWIKTNKSDQSLELHGFSDASNAAFAAVVYARVIDKDNNVLVNLVTAKTRVAPVKQVSIPRLELCGAALLAKLLNEAAQTLNVMKCNIHAWSDSTIVLAWLSSHPSKWKTFVANRVSDILTTLDGNQWSHVVSEENPADHASRGLSPSECVQNLLWIHGPEWLKSTNIDYKRFSQNFTKLEEKKVKVKCLVSAHDGQDGSGEEILLRYSSLNKLLRIVSLCRRFLLRRKPNARQNNEPTCRLTVQELHDAMTTCIKICQNNTFRDEIEALQTSKAVGKRSKLVALTPFLDENSVLRVGGRLQNASVTENMKHPVIIPHNTHLAKLLAQDAHQKTIHGGPQLMLNFIRSKYWVIGAKSIVRQIVRKCVTCVRHSNQINQQMMGQLPTARVTAHRAFHRSGVDYAGPINIRCNKGRGFRSTKGYICVFVCMAVKAVHLEVVSDMTSEAFLAAFKRFSARRGHVAELWSDNGTTFVGAARQLNELFDVERSSVACEISDWLTCNGTAWHFIPPHSPNFGGLWEAAVKSTKFHLARVIGKSTLTFEEMTTTLSQIEACLNSRPLSQLSNDPDDPSPLTPGHFLVGEPLLLAPDDNYEGLTISSLKRWHLTQRMVQDFWRRWSEEYLTQLQNRYKWTARIAEPDVGDVVLIKEDNLPPARWLYGRITDKYPGKDGLTRVVSLKCKGQIIKRPISKIITLPKAD